MTMFCTICGGPVFWKGPCGAITHAQCAACGAIDSQFHEVPMSDEHTQDLFDAASEGGGPD